MDRRHVESRSRLHEDQPGLQALLRRDIRRTISWRAGTSLRAGVRSQVDSRKAGRTVEVEFAQDGVCQLDERPVPHGCSG